MIFDPQATSYEQMRGLFCENHDPSQGMREGNSDHSRIYSSDARGGLSRIKSFLEALFLWAA